jgi:hypothetical protein
LVKKNNKDIDDNEKRWECLLLLVLAFIQQLDKSKPF